MGGKYSSKPVKKDDPSLNLEGGSPGKVFKAPKYKQLSLPIRLSKMKQKSPHGPNHNGCKEKERQSQDGQTQVQNRGTDSSR